MGLTACYLCLAGPPQSQTDGDFVVVWFGLVFAEFKLFK